MLNCKTRIHLVKISISILCSLIISFTFCAPMQAFAESDLNENNFNLYDSFEVDQLNTELNINKTDNGTLTCDKSYGFLISEGLEWTNHCALWHSYKNWRKDTNEYNSKFKFKRNDKIEMAAVKVKNIDIDCEKWIAWNCVIHWNAQMSDLPDNCQIYVKPRVSVYDIENNRTAKYEESGNGVQIWRNSGNHYVMLDKDEFLSEESTKDAPDDLLDQACSYEYEHGTVDGRYSVIVDKITVRVVVEKY